MSWGLDRAFKQADIQQKEPTNRISRKPKRAREAPWWRTASARPMDGLPWPPRYRPPSPHTSIRNIRLDLGGAQHMTSQAGPVTSSVRTMRRCSKPCVFPLHAGERWLGAQAARQRHKCTYRSISTLPRRTEPTSQPAYQHAAPASNARRVPTSKSPGHSVVYSPGVAGLLKGNRCSQSQPSFAPARTYEHSVVVDVGTRDAGPGAASNAG